MCSGVPAVAAFITELLTLSVSDRKWGKSWPGCAVQHNVGSVTAVSHFTVRGLKQKQVMNEYQIGAIYGRDNGVLDGEQVPVLTGYLCTAAAMWWEVLESVPCVHRGCKMSF